MVCAVGSQECGTPAFSRRARAGRREFSGGLMPHDERKRAEMRSMGFTDDVMIDRALTRARGDVEAAVEMLFEGVIPPHAAAAFELDSDGAVVRRSPRTATHDTHPTATARAGSWLCLASIAPARPGVLFRV